MLQTTKILSPLIDEKISILKNRFFKEPQNNLSRDEFIEQANSWFLATKINRLNGLEKFPHKDVIIGCTQFIENICVKHKWNIQVLPEDYAYYSVMGKQSTNVGKLLPGIPLIVSILNW